MTESATAFVSPLTFQALTGREVRLSLLDPKAEAGMGHIELARWADLILVAPCTANTLAQLAQGQAPDLLTTLWVAAHCEKAIAPAMNQQMWKHDLAQENLQRLVSSGTHIVGPDSGIQACGDVGSGRMSEPMDIVLTLESVLVARTTCHIGKSSLPQAQPTSQSTPCATSPTALLEKWDLRWPKPPVGSAPASP